MENNLEKPSIFCFPSIGDEIGEIERIASLYSGEEGVTVFKQQFLEKAKNSTLSELSEEEWLTLENTDSFDIEVGDWDKVEEHSGHVNQTTGSNRSWQQLRLKMEKGEELDAPIILKHEGRLHLVSGNTRLMVARALGVKPQVLIVEL